MNDVEYSIQTIVRFCLAEHRLTENVHVQTKALARVTGKLLGQFGGIGVQDQVFGQGTNFGGNDAHG